MAETYAYRVRTIKGRTIKGKASGENEYQVAESLRKEGYFVLDIRKRLVNLNFDFSDVLNPKPKARDMEIYCSQMSTMLQAGVSLLNILEILEKQSLNKKLSKATAEVRKDVAEGNNIGDAFNKHRKVFHPLFLHMVEAGEAGGILDNILERMASHFDKEHLLVQKVRGALTYPAVVAVMAMAAVFFLVSFVVPSFVSIFDSAGAILPFPTRMLLGVSSIITNYWYILILVVIVAVVIGFYFINKPMVKKRIDYLVLDLPLFGSLLQKVATVRFCRSLGMLLNAGIGLISALEIAQKTAGNSKIEDAIDYVKNEVQRGGGLANLMGNAKVFLPMLVQMVSVGEETGNLDDMLVRASVHYDRDVEHTVARLSTLIEPAMILVVGLIVGFVVISIAMPLFNLSQVVT